MDSLNNHSKTVGPGLVGSAVQQLRGQLGDIRIAARRWIDVALPPVPYGPFAFAAAFKAKERISGDYLEFGVYKGKCFANTCKLIERQERRTKSAVPTRFLAFDAFAAPAGERNWLLCSEQEFRDTLQRRRIDMTRVEIIKGFFEDSLTDTLASEIGLKEAAIVFFDCSVPGTELALEWVTHYLVDGAIIMFDEWTHYRANPQIGQQGVFHRWIASHPELAYSDFVAMETAYAYHGHVKSLIIHRLPSPK